MRFFRIPAFTGIETHRDDADRGSLRVVEGCVPHGPGGLRSGPVWQKIGNVDLFSDSDQNHMTAGDDGKGNSVVYVSRAGQVHDLAVFSTEHTDIVSLGASYAVAAPTLYTGDDAVITPIGNRLYAMGDGSAEAAYIGKGPPTATASIFPDEELYDQEWSRFPNCKFYTQGPKKTIFAAGNPDKPLTVYISEPAGLTNPYRDSPHSTELTNHNPGVLSTVDILSSNASKITALSTRGDQVVVHTDKGCHLLYSPQADQASTGFRVEQVPATNFSGAVNSQVVAGESGSQHFWLGHDGQIYKDEAASRGAEDFKNYADAAQANWKAKGQWEKEHPTDLSDAFATYDPQSGMYWIYVRSDEHLESISDNTPGFPLNLQSSVTPDAPGVPTSLSSSVFIGPPGVPTSLTSSVIPDAPGIPTSFSSNITVAPGTPNALSSFILFEPGTPTNLNSSVLSEPGTPTSLSSSFTHSIPGTPTNLNSVITAIDAPGVPTSLGSSVVHDPLFNFTFPSGWDQQKKNQFIDAGARIEQILTTRLSIDVLVTEDPALTGLTYASSGNINWTANGLKRKDLNELAETHHLQSFSSWARVNSFEIKLNPSTVSTLTNQATPLFKTGLYYTALHELFHGLGIGNFWNQPSLNAAHNTPHTPSWDEYTTHYGNDRYNLVQCFGGFSVQPPQYIGARAAMEYYTYVSAVTSYPNATVTNGFMPVQHGSGSCSSTTFFGPHLYGQPSNTGCNISQAFAGASGATTYTQRMYVNEIMSPGYQNGDDAYISKLTIGMLNDIGYNVDFNEGDHIEACAFQ